MNAPASGPVTSSDRIVSIDVLRGFALLGILVVNIQSFSMIQAAYFNCGVADFRGAGGSRQLRSCFPCPDRHFFGTFPL